MNKSGSGTITAHRKVGQSTTLNRKYVKRPGLKESRDKITEDYYAEQLARRQARAEEINRREAARLAEKQRATQQAAIALRARRAAPVAARPTASELKEAAIKKALKTVEKEQPAEPEKDLKASPKFGIGRILLALGCATVSVLAIAYLVNINMPEFSLRVAAMQTGIEPTYPNYIPAGYSQNGVSAEGEKISIAFGHNNGNSFTLSEEKSSWDSTTLLNNYIKPEFGEEYSTIREHGLTVYVASSAAAWVNGGIAYKLTFTENSLTKNQIISLATSL